MRNFLIFFIFNFFLLNTFLGYPLESKNYKFKNISVGDEIGYVQDQSNLKLVINQKTGSYRVEYNEKPWLSGGNIQVYADKQWFSSTQDNKDYLSLKFVGIEEGAGSDSIGEFRSINISWQLNDNVKTPVNTIFYIYNEQSIIVFEQLFPEGLINTSVGDFRTAITAFPSFALEEGILPSLNYITWDDTWHSVMIQGKGLKNLGVDGLPLVIYDDKVNSVVLSPLNNFMIGIQSVGKDNRLSCGIEGEVEAIPAKFSYKTILYAGKGINKVMYDWGEVLLKAGNKERTDPYADVTLSYLQYWTDNGAYYYYSPEPGKNYEETLLDVKNYLDTNNIPVGAMQLDSWWYYKENNQPLIDKILNRWPLMAVYAIGGGFLGGPTTLWEEKPEVFPSGLKSFYDKLKLPLILHNRHWSSNINEKYLKNFSDIIVENKGSCPVGLDFWNYLMGWAKKQGAYVYEQDWLITEIESIDALRKKVGLSEAWLTNMGKAAEEQGLTIQYCMQTARFTLQSTTIPAVTHERVSADYGIYFLTSLDAEQLYDLPYLKDLARLAGRGQWKIGKSSMLTWALGIWPYKDIFWSSNLEPGHSPVYLLGGGAREPWPERQALVASLSGGPVAFGDGIGYMNKEILMKTCRDDGLILKPDKPATPIDRTFTSDAPPAEVWDTFSTKEGKKWHYIFVFDQEKAFELNSKDIELRGDYIAYNFETGEVRKLPAGSSLTIDKNTKNPWAYWILSPIMENGMALIGDVFKFITAANERIMHVYVKDNKFSIEVKGVAGEKANIALFSEYEPNIIKVNNKTVDNDKWSYNKNNKLLNVYIQFDNHDGKHIIEIANTSG